MELQTFWRPVSYESVHDDDRGGPINGCDCIGFRMITSALFDDCYDRLSALFG